MRRRGTIAEWNDRRGYGFIEPDGNAPRVFLHISELTTPNRRPWIGDIVSFETEPGRKRGPRAVEVVYLEPVRSDRFPLSLRDMGWILVSAVALAVVAIGVLNRALPVHVIIAYGIASAMSLVIYFQDKAAATEGRWRTPEAKLHLLSLLGGWPGALIAQRVLRHKTRKTSFQFGFWMTVLANVAFVAGLWYRGA